MKLLNQTSLLILPLFLTIFLASCNKLKPYTTVNTQTVILPLIETKTVETITTEDWFVYKDTTMLGKLMDRSGDYYTFLTDEGYVSTATNDLMGIEWYGQQIFYESGDCLGSLNYVSAKLSGTVGFYTTDPISYYMIDKASKQIVSNSYIEWGNCVVKEQVVFVSSYTVNDPQKSGVDENLVGSVYIEKGPL